VKTQSKNSLGMSKFSKIASGSLLLSSANIINALANFLFWILQSRRTSGQILGDSLWLFSFINLISVIAMLGRSEAITRQGLNLQQTFRRLITPSVIAIALGAVVLVWKSFATGQTHFPLSNIIFVIAVWQNVVFVLLGSYCIAHKRSGTLLVASVLSFFVRFAVFVCLSSNSVFEVILPIITSSFTACLLICFQAIRGEKKRGFHLRAAAQSPRVTSGYAFANWLGGVVSLVPVTFVLSSAALMNGTGSVPAISIPFTIFTAACIPFSALGTHLFAQLAREQDSEEIRKEIQTSFAIASITAIAISIAGFLFTPLMLKFFSLSDTASAIRLLQWLSLTILITAHIFLLNGILNANGNFVGFALANFGGSFILTAALALSIFIEPENLGAYFFLGQVLSLGLSFLFLQSSGKIGSKRN
jgi:O-antigen/teichoic acid export membrane protein